MAARASGVVTGVSGWGKKWRVHWPLREMADGAGLAVAALQMPLNVGTRSRQRVRRDAECKSREAEGRVVVVDLVFMGGMCALGVMGVKGVVCVGRLILFHELAAGGKEFQKIRLNACCWSCMIFLITVTKRVNRPTSTRREPFEAI